MVEYESDDFYTVVEPILRAEVEALKESGKLEKLCLMKPYSFVLVDEDKETVAELLLVDEDDTLLLNDELLKGLDEELDDLFEGFAGTLNSDRMGERITFRRNEGLRSIHPHWRGNPTVNGKFLTVSIVGSQV